LAWRLLDALREGDFSVERFEYVDQLQKGLIRYNDELVNASYIGFGDYQLWNAVYRVWCAAEVPINLRFDRFLDRFEQARDDEVFRQMEVAPYPGLLMPDLHGYKEIWDQMVRVCDEVDLAGRDATEAGRELMDRIRRSPAVLGGIGIQDEGRRFLFPGPAELSAMARWLVTDAPEEMRYLVRGVGIPATGVGSPAVDEQLAIPG
jgi:FADH2 O2-dependent halogenase